MIKSRKLIFGKGITVSLIALSVLLGANIGHVLIEKELVHLPFLSPGEDGSNSDDGGYGGTRSASFEEDFDDGSFIDLSKSDAVLMNGEVILPGTPKPDMGHPSKIPLISLSKPPHTYEFHPNAMTYDQDRNSLVLSLQGRDKLLVIDRDDGRELDNLEIESENSTGVTYHDGSYYYCVGAGDADGQDLYRYQKDSDTNTPFGDSTESEDGYPLVVADNHIYKGVPYKDGKEDWGQINELEKVSLADPDTPLNKYPLSFNGVADLAYDGEYIWVLKEDEQVSLYLLDKNGNEMDSFTDIYDPERKVGSDFRPVGLAYADGFLYVLLYEEVDHGSKETSLLKIALGSKYSDRGSLYSKDVYGEKDKISSVSFDFSYRKTTGTEIGLYLLTDEEGGWQEILFDDAIKGEWFALPTSSDLLKYRIELESEDPTVTPAVSDLEIKFNSVIPPGIVEPTEGAWVKRSPTFVWDFQDNDPGDEQHGFELEVAVNSSFREIARETFLEESTETHTFEKKFDAGTYYWRVRTKDGRKGWSPFSVPAEFRIDTKKPRGSVEINGGNATTYSPKVVLRLSASDEGSGVEDMFISNRSELDEEYGYWEEYKEEKEWVFSSVKGKKTIYVWFRDGTGQIGSMRSDSIELKDEGEDAGEGILGMGKIGNLDVFYLLLVVIILVVIMVFLFLSRQNRRDYYDDYYDEEEEEFGEGMEDEIDTLEQIRRRRLKELRGGREEEEEEEYEEEAEEEEGFIEGGGRYGSAGTTPSLEESPYTRKGREGVEEEESIEVKRASGRYGASSDDFLGMSDSPYSRGPPALDDFMRTLEEEIEEEMEEGEDEYEAAEGAEEDASEKRQMPTDREREIWIQLGALERRRDDAEERLKICEDPEKETEIKAELGEIENLIEGLLSYLPEAQVAEADGDDDLPVAEVSTEVPEEPPGPPEDIADDGNAPPGGGGTGAPPPPTPGATQPEGAPPTSAQPPSVPQSFADRGGAPENLRNAQQMLSTHTHQLHVIQQQMMNIQQQFQQADPQQQQTLQQQYMTLQQQQQVLQQQIQQVQQYLTSLQGGGGGGTGSGQQTAQQTQQLVQQYQAIQQEMARIQNTLKQIQDPGQRQGLIQQYQNLQQQLMAIQQKFSQG